MRLLGPDQAHLLRLTADGLTPVESFEAIDGRDAWYTPWGDPADVRSIAAALDGTLHVNVHVGGVARSRDAGRSWAPTVDIESDVHQVLAHPARADVVLAAAAAGFGLSRDGGGAWQFITAGLHAHYLRALPTRPAVLARRQRRHRLPGRGRAGRRLRHRGRQRVPVARRRRALGPP